MSTNANAINAGMESSVVAGDHGVGGVALKDGGAQNLSKEALSGSPGDSSPNIAVQAMRGAQAGIPMEHGVSKMLNNGFSIEDKHGMREAKLGEPVAIVGGLGAKALAGGRGAWAEAEGAGATAIAEGRGASAVAEGRNAHAVAEGPNAHAIADGPGARAIAEDQSHKGFSRPDSPLRSDQPILKGHPVGEPIEGKMAPPLGEKLIEAHAEPIQMGQRLPVAEAIKDH